MLAAIRGEVDGAGPGAYLVGWGSAAAVRSWRADATWLDSPRRTGRW